MFLCCWRRKLSVEPKIIESTFNILVLVIILKRLQVRALVKDAKVTTSTFGPYVEVLSLPSSKVLIFIIGLVCFWHTSINSGLLPQINLDAKFIMKCGFVA